MDQFPIRINRYLALKGEATRRGADTLIEQGLVTINGKTAKLGDTVKKEDIVKIKEQKNKKEFVYFAYNKPRGVITHSPQEGEKDIETMIKRRDIFPIGRLDKDSSGLMLLTNDGRLTDRLLNPKYEHEKEYEVEMDRPIEPRDIKRLEAGIRIEGYKTKPTKVKKLGSRKLTITLTEGKKHQIRRMLAAVGIAVRSLNRTRVMNIKLGTLKPNTLRELGEAERNQFLTAIKLPNP